MEKIEFMNNYSSNTSKMNNYNLFYIKTDNWTFYINNEIKSKNVLNLKIEFDNVNFFKENNFDLLLKIQNPLIENNGRMKTDSNGYFTMNREKNDNFEKSVFPFTSFVKILNNKNSENSTSIFNDRAQGVVNDEEGSLMVYLQRTTTTQSFEEVLDVKKPFFVEFSLLNTEIETDWDFEYLKLVNKKDIHLFTGFFKKEKRYKDIKKNYNLNNKNITLSKKNFGKLNLDFENKKINENKNFNENFRLNVDFVDEKSFIIRLQSLNRKKILKINSEIFLNGFFGDLIFKEITFDYIISENPETPKNVETIIELNPLEFKTFLAKIRYK